MVREPGIEGPIHVDRTPRLHQRVINLDQGSGPGPGGARSAIAGTVRRGVIPRRDQIDRVRPALRMPGWHRLMS